MGERWRELLTKLGIEEDDLLKLIERACRAQPRFRQVGDTRKLVDSVHAAVFIALAPRLKADPGHRIFHDADEFRRYVWIVARNSDDPDARRHRAKKAKVIFCSPDDLSGVKGHLDTRNLDCPQLCDDLLRGAVVEHRDAFLAMCEGFRQTGDILTFKELGDLLHTSSATAHRRWGVAVAIIRRKSGKDHTDPLDGE
jgi:hypothetical protein